MKTFLKKAAKRIVKTAAVGGALALAGAHQAMAAGVDISADTTAAKADIATAGALIIGVVVSVAAISWIRRVIK